MSIHHMCYVPECSVFYIPFKPECKVYFLFLYLLIFLNTHISHTYTSGVKKNQLYNGQIHKYII